MFATDTAVYLVSKGADAIDFFAEPSARHHRHHQMRIVTGARQINEEQMLECCHDTGQEVRVTVRTALAIANDPAMPRWLPSSEFQRPQP